MNDLKRLGQLIEIATAHGHRVETSTTKPVGDCGPAVSFGCDVGGAFVRVAVDGRLTIDDARTLVADLLNAIHYAAHREWLCDHGMAVRVETET